MVDENVRNDDPIAMNLRASAQNIVVVVFGLLPLIFVPTAIAPFDYTKSAVAVLAIFIALVLYSLSVLRSGTITVGLPYTLGALWVIAGIAFISSLLSGDFKDSLIGDLFSIHSTVFVAILALIPTVWMLLKPSKQAVVRMYILIAISTLVLVAFHIARLILGPEFLSLGVFTGTTTTPVGSWNDLALFLGLAIILSLVAFEQLTLSKGGKILFGIVVLTSLCMLGVINFFTVWLILGITSLAMVVYALGKDRFSNGQLPLIGSQTTNTTSLIIALVVCAISVFFVVGGSTFGSWVTKYTNISYVEVRPSLEATANIARNVYTENAFLGIGTNKFIDAWRLYKEDSINYTPFWNTDFNAGNGYITTFFVSTGVLGGIAWVIFLITYLVTGIRRLLGATNGDKMWYFIGLSSFVSAVYIWGISVIYVPGVVILLLGALCTGVSLYSFNVLNGYEGRTFSIGTNRRTGFALTLAVVTIIIGSVSILYVAGRHYSSVYAFNESVRSMQQGIPIDDLEKQVESAYQLSESDVFARRIAEYQLARMNNLIVLPSPTDVERKQFQDASDLGIYNAQLAVRIDALEPANWSVLGRIYAARASVGAEGAQDRAIEALGKSRELNPKNPLPYLESAVVEAQAGNYAGARSYIEKAITLKPNFTEALYFLTQLEVVTGNVEGAIRSTQAIISLEPQNPARYYQLGVLESSRGKLEASVSALEQAIALDKNYANARYLLALAYDELGRSEDAKMQLQAVLDLNPGNVEVTELIREIEANGSLGRLRSGVNGTVDEAVPTTDENGTVQTLQDPETSLVTPVNTTPKTREEDSDTAQ